MKLLIFQDKVPGQVNTRCVCLFHFTGVCVLGEGGGAGNDSSLESSQYMVKCVYSSGILNFQPPFLHKEMHGSDTNILKCSFLL